MKILYNCFRVNKLLILCIFSTSTFYLPSTAQIKNVNHSYGAVLLPDSIYRKIPAVNWDTLRKYAPNNQPGFVRPLSVNGITMLNNPPVGDQGSEGSCVGWSTGYSALGILLYSKYNCWNAAIRSPKYVYNQIKISNCASGSYVTSGLDLLKFQGVCSWTSMPYNDPDCNTQPTTAQRNEALLNKSSSYGTVGTTDVSGLQNALDLGYPIVIAFEVYQSFETMWANQTGIWNSNVTDLHAAHSTTIIGYDNTRQMFKVQNQWGTAGGDHGFFWIPYSFLQTGPLSEAYIVYGTSTTAPMYINGSSNFCTGSTSYSVTYLPTGSTVAWSSNNTSIATVSSTGVLTRVADGTMVITATVTNCGGTNPTVITKTVTIGSINSLTGTYTMNSTYPLQTFNSVPAGSITGNFTWTSVSNINISPSGSGTWYYGTSNSFSFSLASGQNMNLYFTGTGTCGAVNATRTFQQSGGYAIITSPNPSSGSIVVTISDVPDTSTIGSSQNSVPQNNASQITKFSLYEINSGFLIKQWIYQEADNKRYNFNLNGIQSGVYVLKMERNNKIASTKLIIQ
jgi:hypothetical protein